MGLSLSSSRRSLLAFALSLPFLAYAQQKESVLSDAEVETLRDRAYDPPARVLAFVQFLDDRTKGIDKLNAGRRRPGREQDTHDLMEQFTSVSDDFEDNLDDYAKRHRDVRKVLPKVIAASERWQTALKSPPDHESYNVSRKLALEAAADLREAATKLLEEQKTYFLAHPPEKNEGRGGTPGR